jgi:hypothetical protein
MVFENENFIIYYNECDERYLNKLINIVTLRMPEIVEFFKLDFKGKITIKLYNDLEQYKSNLISSFERNAKTNNEKPREYQSWMIANTEDGNINMQTLDLVMRQEDYKNYTEEEFCYNACHEFTHLCQQQIKSENPGWFWEVLATTLGNPECQHEIKEKFTLDDLYNFDNIDGYGAVYKIGKYLFENYDSDYILEMVKNNDKLFERIPKIIDSLNERKHKI